MQAFQKKAGTGNAEHRQQVEKKWERTFVQQADLTQSALIYPCSRMLLKILVFLLFIAQFLMSSTADNATEIGETKGLSISQDYAILRSDVQWFFQHLEILADSFQRLLPAAPARGQDTHRSFNSENNGTFVESTRLYLLLGLRHVLVGLKEISVAFQQKFNTDQVQELQQIRVLMHVMQDIVRIAKDWFATLRVSLAQLFRLYNHYIPEVLLGKCFGRYIVARHPNRAFYEYPFLLLGEIFEQFLHYVSAAPSQQSLESKTTESAEELSVEQNEIWPLAQDDFKPRSMDQVDVSDPLQVLVQADVANMNDTSAGSWQRCLKMYMADTISRQLKSFFLDGEY